MECPMLGQRETRSFSRVPLLMLLHAREQTRTVVLLMLLGVPMWGVVAARSGIPLWIATAVVLAVLLIPGVQKWHADYRQYGGTIMLLSVVVTMQGFHSLEHAAQVIQYHVMHWPLFLSSGLISAANA